MTADPAAAARIALGAVLSAINSLNFWPVVSGPGEVARSGKKSDRFWRKVTIWSSRLSEWFLREAEGASGRGACEVGGCARALPDNPIKSKKAKAAMSGRRLEFFLQRRSFA